MKKEVKKKERVKGNLIAWLIYTFFSRIFMFFKHHIKYNYKVFKKRNKKIGSLVIYNHMSNMDHYISTAAFKYRRANYVITRHFYFNKTLKSILECVAAIPREQFKSDLISIRKIKKVIDKKGIVAIAPAGQISVHGDLIYIDPAIIKLVKFCKTDVFSLQIHGNYLSYPKWRRTKRSYPISCEFVKVLTIKDLETLSDEEIYDRIIKSIDVSDRELQKVKPHKIKGKSIIEGLETITYYCPKCKSKHTFVTKGDLMTCSKCGNQIRMNNYGFLEPVSSDCVMFSNEHLWYDYEKELIKKQIIDGTLHIEGKYKLFRNLNEQWTLEEVGEGKVVLTTSEFYYEGTINNELVRKDFKLDKLIQLPFGLAERFDVPDDEGTFQFRPVDNINQIIEYVQSIDVMRELKQGSN